MFAFLFFLSGETGWWHGVAVAIVTRKTLGVSRLNVFQHDCDTMFPSNTFKTSGLVQEEIKLRRCAFSQFAHPEKAQFG